MKEQTKKISHKKKKRGFQLSPAQIIAIVFAIIILLGTLLLSLPVASRNGQSCGILPALFTATSATCVTGLSLFDTWTQWSGFGQIVILCMIETGGLGFMSAASFVVFLFRKKVGLRQKMLIAQALSLNEMDSVVRVQKWVLLGSLIIQLTGMAILFLRFWPTYGAGQAATWSLFHAVSAFCNAGFDLMGFMGEYCSLTGYYNDFVVNIDKKCIILLLEKSS